MQLKIITTYKIKDCKLWDENVHFIEMPSRYQNVKNKFFQYVAGIIDNVEIIFTYFSVAEKYDILLTNSDRPSNLFAIMQAIMGKRIHHVMLNCLWRLPRTALGTKARKIYFRLISKGVDKFIVFAQHEIEDYNKCFEIPREKFVYISFYFTPLAVRYKPRSGDYIFSGGQFYSRNYRMLLSVVGQLQMPCKIATQSPECFSQLEVPSCVEISHLSREEFFRCMANSKLVVMPVTKGLLYSVAQRSYLDAMLMGKPLIVCDDKGVFDYIINGKEAIVVPPDNEVALKEAILKAITLDNDIKDMTKRAQKKARQFTIDSTMGKVLTLLEKVVLTNKIKR